MYVILFYIFTYIARFKAAIYLKKASPTSQNWEEKRWWMIGKTIDM